MSVASRCGSCLMGDHDGHVYEFGLIPGLIGGAYCACGGDCASEFVAEAERFNAMFGESS